MMSPSGSKYVLFCCGLFGKMPLLNLKTGELLRSRIIPIVITICIVASTTLTLGYADNFYEHRFLSLTKTILSTVTNVRSALYTGIVNFGHFEDLLDITASTDELLLKFSLTPKDLKRPNLVFISTIAYFVLVAAYDLYSFYNFKSYEAFMYIVNGYLQGFFIYFDMTLQIFLLHSIYQRVCCFSQAVREIQENRNTSEQSVQTNVENLVELYDKLCDAIGKFNRIFGWQIFLETVTLLTAGLNLVDYVLVNGYKDFSSLYLITSLLITCLSLLIIVVVYCEWISNEWSVCNEAVCKSIVKTVDVYRTKLWYKISHQIFTRPFTMSAAGFFKVNYYILFVAANMLLGYIIVIIQLNRQS